MIVTKAETIRTTELTLTHNEIEEALIAYVKGKDVIDTEQHFVFDIKDTRTEEGYRAIITINNYNKGNNIYENKSKGFTHINAIKKQTTSK